MTFDFHPEARDEIQDAAHWYEDHSVFAGDRFVKAVREAIAEIMLDPLRYQSFSDGIHVFRLKTFPYRLYYTFEQDQALVRVFAVMHEKRRPGYWHERLGA